MDEIKSAASNSAIKTETVVKPLETNKSPNSTMKFSTKTLVVVLLIAALGAATGYGVYAYRTAGTLRLGGRDMQVVNTSTEEGVKDASTFKDTATGQLIENDAKITDEGTHILVRGDASQNVYLTSSVVDMTKYVGKKVQVWGETFAGRKAGWLLDVGRIKVL